MKDQSFNEKIIYSTSEDKDRSEKDNSTDKGCGWTVTRNKDAEHKQHRQPKKGSYPCTYGPLCRYKGLCKFDHSSGKSLILCRFGNQCRRQGCVYAHQQQPEASMKVLGEFRRELPTLQERGQSFGLKTHRLLKEEMAKLTPGEREELTQQMNQWTSDLIDGRQFLAQGTRQNYENRVRNLALRLLKIRKRRARQTVSNFRQIFHRQEFPYRRNNMGSDRWNHTRNIEEITRRTVIRGCKLGTACKGLACTNNDCTLSR